ncbi:hypothetical protein [uncultured Maribacter sp.]|uniref:hypothetical protein n=1 Tax=uncultured Maribacter sp. TaxID=431308 RepID=UPI0026049504|nr:hypothetical protein [uncultured Maribacter sp.]
MNAKWYIGTLFIILAIIGLSQEQTKVANQQIVLQFTDVEKNAVTNYDDALVIITKKLQALGVANIEIIENNSSQLSIRYYSDIDAISVKEILSQDKKITLAYKDIDQLPVDFPKDKLPKNYDLVVSDLQQQTDNGLNLHGKFAFVLKQGYKKLSYPVAIPFNNSIVFKEDAKVHLAYKINRGIAIAIDNTSYTIPGVRAGPNGFC